MAPPLAIIFMDSLERQFNNTAAHKPDIYIRYIYDVLGVWTNGSDNLRLYLQHINNAHPSIRFTIETTEDGGSIPFLDTKLTVEPTGRYTTELYIKPLSAGIIMHANSAQPWKAKRAVLYSQIQRAIRLSSSQDACQRSIERIKELFSNNGYNTKTINNAIDSCKNQGNRRNAAKTSRTRMILPFIDDKLAGTVQAVIRGSGPGGLGVTWTNDNTIKRLLVRSALKPPPCPGGARCHACAAGLQGRCHTSGVVYQLWHVLCAAGHT